MSTKIELQGRVASAAARSTRLRLPLWLALPGGMALGLAIVMLVVRAGAILFAPPTITDALSPYAALMPGQPAATLDNYACNTWWFRSNYSNMPDLCVLNPLHGAFNSITISVSENLLGSIHFQVRSLRVIDLVWRWGQPDEIRGQVGPITLWWKRASHIFAHIDGRYRLQAPVRYLIITDVNLSTTIDDPES